jgi:phosphoribosyl-ATP pyrophosphohydrolase
VLVDFVRKVRETDDPQYDQIFMILNKISSKTMNELSAEALSIVKERDEQFRLRVTTLIFDKAIKGSAYAGLMSDIAQKMAVEIPEVAEDLETHALMFTTLYDMSETLVFPKLGDADFEGKVILWSRQKDVRRGYARFLTHLFSRGLVSGKALQESMQKVIEDLRNTVIETKTEQSEENVTQFADFLYEIAKLLNPTAVELRGLILSELTKLLARPRTELPSLNMRSRFKLEDTVKCVKVC